MRLLTTLSLFLVSLTMVLEAAQKDAAAIYQSLATPPKKVQANIPLRSSAYSALALIPQDVAGFVAVREFSEKVCSLMFSSLVKSANEQSAAPSATVLSRPEVAKAVHSFAVACSEGNVETFGQYLPVYSCMVSRREGLELSAAWSEVASPHYAETINKSKFTLSRQAAIAALRKMNTSRLHPIYAVLTLKPGSARYLSELLDECVKVSAAPAAKSADISGFKGWKYQGSALMEDVDPSDPIGRQVKNFAAGRSIYQLYKIVGNSIVMVICENPADCKIPTEEEQSVLSSDKLAFCDHSVRRGSVVASYISAPLMNVLAGYSNAGTNILASYAASVFRALSTADEENALIFNPAARGAVALGKWLSSFTTEKNKHPFTLCSWRMPSGAVHIRMSMDACGAAYAPGVLRMPQVGRSAMTLFYTESTPYTPVQVHPWPDLITHAVRVFGAFDHTLSESITGGASTQFAARLHTSMTALKSVGSALGKSSAAVIFNVKGVPHVSYFNTIADMSALTKAAEKLSSSAGSLFGGGKNLMKKYYKVKKGKKATSISFSLPKELTGLKPNILFTSNKIAIGSIAALNNLVLKNSYGSSPFTGAVYSLRLSALMPYIGATAAAAASDPSAAMAVGMAGTLVGSVGDIHAVDTITNGLRNVHVLVKAPSPPAASGAPVAPVPAVPSGPSPTPADDETDEDEPEPDAPLPGENEPEEEDEDSGDWESEEWD